MHVTFFAKNSQRKKRSVSRHR